MPRTPRLLALPLLLSSCGPTTPAATDTAATTDATTGADTSTSTSGASTGPTTGPLEPCGCAEPLVIAGDLDLAALAGLTGACVGEVTGRVRIIGLTDPAALQPLVGLKRVDTLELYDNPGLTDLSVFACLEEVNDRLSITSNPALVDLGALARVRTVGTFELRDLPITALPGFAPEFYDLARLDLERLPHLADLAPIAGWASVAVYGGAVSVSLVDVPALASIAELAGLLSGPNEKVRLYLELIDLPALTSLSGLEAMQTGSVTLTRLPQVTSLLPLSGIETLLTLQLDDLPGLSSLEGLHHLGSAEEVRLTAMPGLTTLDGLRALTDAVDLQLGGCGDDDGLDGLTDLSGLDALTRVDLDLSLIGDAGLTVLSGAPNLVEVGWLDVIDDPKLTQAAVDAFTAKAGVKDLCRGDQVECICLGTPPAALTGCPAAWSGGSAVTVSGEAGPLLGATAFFGWTYGTSHYVDLNLVIADAGADLEAVRDDGLWQTSAAGVPKLLLPDSASYHEVLGEHAASGILTPDPLTSIPVDVNFTIVERLGDWTMIDPADPPRLAGEFTVLDPNAATLVEGPFDAVYCDQFSWAPSD